MLRAISFTIVSCGFEPRCALGTVDSSELRFDKICSLVETCQFGVHDLSRTELNEQGLPRFNMPFELGLFLGCKRFGGGPHSWKSALVLDREPYRYQKFISDLSGVDPEAHWGQTHIAVEKVRHWLRSTTHRLLPSPAHITHQLTQYKVDLPELCHSLSGHPDGLFFRDEVHLMHQWLNNAREAGLD